MSKKNNHKQIKKQENITNSKGKNKLAETISEEAQTSDLTEINIYKSVLKLLKELKDNTEKELKEILKYMNQIMTLTKGYIYYIKKELNRNSGAEKYNNCIKNY